MRCAICDVKLTKNDYSDICSVCQWHVKDALNEGGIEEWSSDDLPQFYSSLYSAWGFKDEK